MVSKQLYLLPSTHKHLLPFSLKKKKKFKSSEEAKSMLLQVLRKRKVWFGSQTLCSGANQWGSWVELYMAVWRKNELLQTLFNWAECMTCTEHGAEALFWCPSWSPSDMLCLGGLCLSRLGGRLAVLIWKKRSSRLHPHSNITKQKQLCFPVPAKSSRH